HPSRQTALSRANRPSRPRLLSRLAAIRKVQAGARASDGLPTGAGRSVCRGMKRPVVLIVGAAAGALMVAAVGASAHTGFSLARVVGQHATTFGDEATGARTEPSDTPEPTEAPEAPPTAQPAETPEPADTDTDTDTDTETNDDNETGAAAATKSSPGEHDGGGDHQGAGGGGDSGDQASVRPGR